MNAMLAPATAETLAGYSARAAALNTRYLRSTGADGTSAGFSTWLVSMKTAWAPATYRLYRTSAAHWLDESGEAAAADILRNDITYPAEPFRPKAAVPKRGAALKAKSWPADHFDRVLCYLERFARTRNAAVLADWLRAGMLTGLRPCEWRDARMNGEILVVQSAKATQGRGNGGVRTLDLTGLPKLDVAAVRRMCSRGAEWSERGEFEENQHAAASALSHTVRTLWPEKSPGYCLYSTRHQAIANWKSGGLARIEVSALAGHSTTRCAIESYGRRSSGWRGVNKIATPGRHADQVASVRDTEGDNPFAMARRPKTMLLKPQGASVNITPATVASFRDMGNTSPHPGNTLARLG